MTTSSAAPQDMINVVLINYGPADSDIVFTSSDQISPTEIFQKGQTQNSHTLVQNGNQWTLRIPSEVVVGFSVANVTSLTVPKSRIGVITWLGKDPPVPPPPPRLTKYRETLDFDLRFRAMLGVGSAVDQHADTVNGDRTRVSSSEPRQAREQ